MGLCKLIRKTHRAGIGVLGQDTQSNKYLARERYAKIQQNSIESIITYKERFDEALRNYNDMGNPTMDDESIATDGSLQV